MVQVDNNYLLAIESAISGGSIALFRGGQLVHGASGDKSVSRAEELLPQIIELLAEAGIEMGKLNKVAVSLGPGSYTGLRIGIATVMGLCRGLGIDYVGVPVFDAIMGTYGDQTSIIALPMGRSDICIAQPPVAASQVMSLDQLTLLISESPDSRLLAHSALVSQMTGIKLDAVDIGTNLAKFIGAAAFGRAGSTSLAPIYAQNPRFGNGIPS